MRPASPRESYHLQRDQREPLELEVSAVAALAHRRLLTGPRSPDLDEISLTPERLLAQIGDEPGEALVIIPLLREDNLCW